MTKQTLREYLEGKLEEGKFNDGDEILGRWRDSFGIDSNCDLDEEITGIKDWHSLVRMDMHVCLDT